MHNDSLKLFLRIYGFSSLALFSILMISFAIKLPILDEGSSLHWLIWDKLSDHVGPMLFSIYIVWSIYFLKAANDPVHYASFLDFSAWANLAHGLLMVFQAGGEHEYHSKFMTDIPWILAVPFFLFLMRNQYAPKKAVTS